MQLESGMIMHARQIVSVSIGPSAMNSLVIFASACQVFKGTPTSQMVAKVMIYICKYQNIGHYIYIYIYGNMDMCLYECGI